MSAIKKKKIATRRWAILRIVIQSQPRKHLNKMATKKRNNDNNNEEDEDEDDNETSDVFALLHEEKQIYKQKLREVKETTQLANILTSISKQEKKRSQIADEMKNTESPNVAAIKGTTNTTNNTTHESHAKRGYAQSQVRQKRAALGRAAAKKKATIETLQTKLQCMIAEDREMTKLKVRFNLTEKILNESGDEGITTSFQGPNNVHKTLFANVMVDTFHKKTNLLPKIETKKKNIVSRPDNRSRNNKTDKKIRKQIKKKTKVNTTTDDRRVKVAGIDDDVTVPGPDKKIRKEKKKLKVNTTTDDRRVKVAGIDDDVTVPGPDKKCSSKISSKNNESYPVLIELLRHMEANLEKLNQYSASDIGQKADQIKEELNIIERSIMTELKSIKTKQKIEVRIQRMRVKYKELVKGFYETEKMRWVRQEKNQLKLDKLSKERERLRKMRYQQFQIKMRRVKMEQEMFGCITNSRFTTRTFSYFGR